MKNILNFKNKSLKFSRKKKLLLFLPIILIIGILAKNNVLKKESQIQYETAKVEKGTLIVSVSVSGQVSGANSASVTTQTSGVVRYIYVTNGQEVYSGEPIAEVDLDMDGQQRASQALASYQNAQNSLNNAQATYYSLQSSLFSNWQTYMDTAQSSTYQNPDGTPKTDQRQLTDFAIKNDDWLSAEAKYKNQQGVVSAAQTSLSSAWASYQQSSPIIYAPISGTISGLSLQTGSVLTAQTGSTGNSTSQRIANIKTRAFPSITVNLTEIDAPKIKIGNKATITLDALPEKTFTGKVVSIDTTGSVSSGVTTYPAVIELDTKDDSIFPNMSAQAHIITQIKNDVLLVPVAAVQTQNEQSYVRVLQNGIVVEKNVEIGLTSSTQVEITSGLSEVDNVITSTTSSVSTTGNNTSSSPFGLFGGGNRGFGGGGAVIRTNRD